MELDARFGAFGLQSALLIVTPGPDTALIIRNALAAGPRASTFSALGVGVGTIAWAVAAMLGVGVLLERSAVAFTVLKLAGAAYLCYLGVRSLRHVISRMGASGPGVRVRQAMTRITGLVLIGLGARLALEKRQF